MKRAAFPEPQRSQWLKMLRLALDMVYGSVDDQGKVPEDGEDGDPF